MITLYIDGQQVEAESGSSIIEAADKIGVPIPRFCYHPCLSVAASCRMCLVHVSNASKPVPACATPVTDGLQVFTKSPITQKAQKTVTELLLINHPLDCPVCDQGGECELQDLILQYAGDKSSFKEPKREVPNPELGPLIATEMNRCIHCTRCVRFGDEIAGQPELGGVYRGEDLKITNYLETALESELSGNMIDICPVGALTSKPHRFGGRTWSFRSYPGWLGHGRSRSPIEWHVDKGLLKRVVFRSFENGPSYGPWIADRERFGYLGLFSPERQKELGFMRKGSYGRSSFQKIQQLIEKVLQDLRSWGAIIHPQASLEEVAAIDACLKQAPHSHGMALLSQPLPELPSQPFESTLNNERPKIILGSFLGTDNPIETLQLRRWADQGGILECFSFSGDDRLRIKSAKLSYFSGKNLPQSKALVKKRVKELTTTYGSHSCDIILPESALLHPWCHELLEALNPVAAAYSFLGRLPHWPSVPLGQPARQTSPELLFILHAEKQDWARFEWAQRWVSEAKVIVVLSGYQSRDWSTEQQVFLLPCSLCAEQNSSYPSDQGILQSAQAITPPGEAQRADIWLQKLFQLPPCPEEALISWDRFDWSCCTAAPPSLDRAALEQSLWVIPSPLSCDPILRRSRPLQQTPWALSAQGFWVGPDVLPEWVPIQGNALSVLDEHGHEMTAPYQIKSDLPKGTIIYWAGTNPLEPSFGKRWVKAQQGASS